jgi:hypothetical protein
MLPEIEKNAYEYRKCIEYATISDKRCSIIAILKFDLCRKRVFSTVSEYAEYATGDLCHGKRSRN